METFNRNPDSRDKKAETKAKEILAKPENKISENDFTGIHSEEKLAHDRKTVAELKAKFKNQSAGEGNGITLEAILIDMIKLWFGEKTGIFKTADYDDFVNGVDMLLVLKNKSENQTIALSIDATTSISSLSKKINARLGLTKVDYFYDGNTRGSVERATYNALYLDNEAFNSFKKLWLNYKDAQSELELKNPKSISNFKDLKEKMYTDKIQFVFLYQLFFQLAFFQDKYKQETKKKVFEKNMNLINELINFKAKEFGFTLDEIQKYISDHKSFKAVYDVLNTVTINNPV